MLVTLIPLFDEQMAVSAYSLFAQSKNFLLNPSLLGTGKNDGASNIPGLDILKRVGIDCLTGGKEVFVEVNNISVFSDIEKQCEEMDCSKIVLLMDNTVTPDETYINRLKQLKAAGFKLAMRKLAVANFEKYREILLLTDYILLDHKKIDITKATIYFSNVYPNIKLCAGNIANQEVFDELKQKGGYHLFEGEFFRTPITKGAAEVSPLKINYIELLNMVNDSDFELTRAADIIGRDTALVISLLKMVNRMAVNSEITSIRHAAAMLGQKELKKWINTAVANELCVDKPGEVMRLSLLRAKFAENLAPVFEKAIHSSELFLMGLFSVLDLILDKPMEEALEMVKVSGDIREALVNRDGKFASVLDFVLQYENANWQEVSRQMVLKGMDMNKVYEAYVDSLQWYQNLFVEIQEA